jgi:hypothetical protein
MLLRKHHETQLLAEEKFRRLTGIKHATFDKMVEILTNAQ